MERVLDAWEANSNNETRPGFHRKGYMGHLTKIANIMVSTRKIPFNVQLVEYICLPPF